MLDQSISLSRRSLLRKSALVVGIPPMLSLLAACGSSSTSTVRTASSSTQGAPQTRSAASSATASRAAASQAPGAAKGQVTWLVPEDPLLDQFSRKGIVPDFKKVQPNVEVQVISPGSTAYGQKLLALVAAGTIPEVYTDWGNTGFWTLVKKNLLTDLTTYFGQAKVDPSYLLSIYRKEYSVDGKLMAVPWNSNPNFLVYNKTMFQKYNVPLPPSDWNDKSWTTDKLLETAKALTHKTGNPATATYGLIMGAGALGSLGWLWNADPFNDKGGPEDSGIYQGKEPAQTYPNRQPIVEAMSWLADLTLKYGVSPTPTDAQALSSQGNPIFSGRVGIVEVAAGWLERQAAVAKPHFEWGIAPFPWGPGGRNTSQREDNAWYLGKGSKNPDAGFQLILFSSRGKGADDLIEYAKDNPPIADTSYFTKWSKGVQSIPGFSMDLKSFQNVFEGGIKLGFGDPTNIIYSPAEFSNAFSQLMAPVWIGKQTAQNALTQVKAKWDGILKSLS
ncbi:MAG: extracellular solute-binding protein [Chloroflexi bacterium]|nr:extracellular solute-binding protein [Chloroflexota bacterium]